MTRRPKPDAAARRQVERVQTGVRIERRMLKVLKAIAEYHEMSLGDLIEGIVLHAFEGRAAFERVSLARIREFKRLYGLSLSAADSHQLTERPRPARGRSRLSTRGARR